MEPSWSVNENPSSPLTSHGDSNFAKSFDVSWNQVVASSSASFSPWSLSRRPMMSSACPSKVVTIWTQNGPKTWIRTFGSPSANRRTGSHRAEWKTSESTELLILRWWSCVLQMVDTEKLHCSMRYSVINIVYYIILYHWYIQQSSYVTYANTKMYPTSFPQFNRNRLLVSHIKNACLPGMQHLKLLRNSSESFGYHENDIGKKLLVDPFFIFHKKIFCFQSAMLCHAMPCRCTAKLTADQSSKWPPGTAYLGPCPGR